MWRVTNSLYCSCGESATLCINNKGVDILLQCLGSSAFLTSGSGLEKIPDLGSGFQDGKIRIQDKYPGSATLFCWPFHAVGLV